MRPLTATLAAMFLAAPSPLAHGLVYSGMPPERFQADGYGLVVYVTDVSLYCGSRPGVVIYACHKMIDGVSVTYLPNPCAYGATEWHARLACHEAAHRSGWGANHPL